MSGIASLSMLLTFLFWLLLYNGFEIDLTAGNQAIPLKDKVIITFFGLTLIFVLITLFGAFFIRNWDESYFGMQGAIRWVIFGVVFGSLAQVRLLIPEGATEKGLSSFLIEKGISFVLGATFLYMSHWVAFRLFRKSNKDIHIS